MTKMHDPNDYAAMGPQITARPGTKRHAKQCVARRTFFNILAANEAAKLRRLQAKIDALTSLPVQSGVE